MWGLRNVAWQGEAHLARTTAMRFLPPMPNADGDTLAYFLSPTEEICRSLRSASASRRRCDLIDAVLIACRFPLHILVHMECSRIETTRTC